MGLVGVPIGFPITAIITPFIAKRKINIKDGSIPHYDNTNAFMSWFRVKGGN